MRLTVSLSLALMVLLLGMGCSSNDPVVTTPPTVQLSASAPIVNAGSSFVLQWVSTNADTVVSSNFGAAAVNGTQTIFPQMSITYTLVVQGPAGTAEASVPVQVFTRDDVRGVWATVSKRYEITTDTLRIYNIDFDGNEALESVFPEVAGQRLVYDDIANTVTCELYSGTAPTGQWIPSKQYGIGVLGTLAVRYYYSPTDLWSAWQQLGASKP